MEFKAPAGGNEYRLPLCLLTQLNFGGVPDSDERDELRSLLLLQMSTC
jgi:hypothetical protein